MQRYAHKRVTYDDILRISMDIATAMAFLHPTIIHRDLKPANVLLTKSHAKVADFGIARWKQETYINTQTCAGTVPYMSPELLCGYPASEKVDMYSFGVLLWCAPRSPSRGEEQLRDYPP